MSAITAMDKNLLLILWTAAKNIEPTATQTSTRAKLNLRLNALPTIMVKPAPKSVATKAGIRISMTFGMILVLSFNTLLFRIRILLGNSHIKDLDKRSLQVACVLNVIGYLALVRRYYPDLVRYLAFKEKQRCEEDLA